jgi:hypothetical protein
VEPERREFLTGLQDRQDKESLATKERKKHKRALRIAVGRVTPPGDFQWPEPERREFLTGLQDRPDACESVFRWFKKILFIL